MKLIHKIDFISNTSVFALNNVLIFTVVAGKYIDQSAVCKYSLFSEKDLGNIQV